MTVEAGVSTQRRTVTVDRVHRFAGVYQVSWRDGRKRRRLLVDIAEWAQADETVRASVEASYPLDARPVVQVPPKAWR